VPPLSPDRPHLSPGLYVVATPIGNLEDLSPRARRVLGTARVIAAEDTRVSGLLVRLAEGKGRLLSLTEYNVDERAPELLEAARDGPVALVSDAGTPLVSDPGGRLVEAAHAAGVAVVPVPGPSALVAALSASGFDGSDVRFLGFLPRPPGERRSVVTAAAGAKTLVFFESPSRLPRTLSELADWLGDPEVCVCRELTKAHEDVRRGRASGLAPRFANTRGECTVVVRCPETEGETDEDAAREYMAEMQRAGARRSAAAAEASRRFGIGRERAYTFWSGGVDQDGG
jgi:16S rRNA (cytidine1402-2'-O)-methyltransferase